MPNPTTPASMPASMIERLDIQFHPNLERVVLRPRWLGDERSAALIQHISAFSESDLTTWVDRTLSHYGHRHRQLADKLQNHGTWALNRCSQTLEAYTVPQRLLIGAYFSMEYSVEAAAFFNPSVVLAPDQSHLMAGEERLIFSFRAVGEGHISSIVFHEAILETGSGTLRFPPPSRWVELPHIEDINHAVDAHMVSGISLPNGQSDHPTNNQAYGAQFAADTELSERVLFPELSVESHGLEDARFVQFTDDQGKSTYYATYTAYNGREIQPRLLHTEDFQHFVSLNLTGAGAVNKNLALFPRKIQGRYAMLSRLDGVNNFLMFSDSLTHWEHPVLLNTPQMPWELGNTGNCGSPIETEAGWLVITHGVGPMREYSLGALLLDLEDPGKIIGRLKNPLWTPQADEREGYVPNVVYSCGAYLKGEHLWLPYGASDRFAAVLKVKLADLLEKLLNE
jgi:predicted GH43/DUF377 family glycosyl hydrolase